MSDNIPDRAKRYIGKELEILIDRPLGSKHPEFDMKYEVNYGYIPGTVGDDGEEIDVYYIGGAKAFTENKRLVHRRGFTTE